MLGKTFLRVSRVVAAVVLTVGTGALAQAPTPAHFSGILNDYTAATGVGGPWEMHGSWALKMKGESGMADFSAVMTMEHPDSWIVLNPANIDNPGARSPHTHHITMTDGTVSYDTSSCPSDNPATTGRIVVTGPVSITGNGNAAPFEKKGTSMLQVCITGGTEVEFSNVTLALTGPATGHFGMQAIHGVVRKVKKSEREDRDR
jgi:hypothetical protein